MIERCSIMLSACPKEILGMSLMVKSILAALLAAVAFSTMGVANASAAHPLFLTASGIELSIAGESGLTLFFLLIGPSTLVIHCDKDLFSGKVLNRSPLIHNFKLLLHTKCILVFQGSTTSCKEPIHLFSNALAELGLINSTTKKVAILLAPNSGTEVGKITCGTNEVTIEGAVVGEIPETNSKGEGQYNKQLSELELVFASENSSEKQKITEILLLGTQMTKVELKATGAASGAISLESTEVGKTDGLIEIDTQ
jgi:hypothetical protein